MDSLLSQACFVSFVENAKLDPDRTGSFYSPVFGHLFSMDYLHWGFASRGLVGCHQILWGGLMF